MEGLRLERDLEAAVESGTGELRKIHQLTPIEGLHTASALLSPNSAAVSRSNSA